AELPAEIRCSLISMAPDIGYHILCVTDFRDGERNGFCEPYVDVERPFYLMPTSSAWSPGTASCNRA
ncbi:MAG: hypothetical protein R6W77_09055, partial [Trueperaceae bacterium]